MAPNHGPFSGGSETATGRGSNAIAAEAEEPDAIDDLLDATDDEQPESDADFED